MSDLRYRRKYDFGVFLRALIVGPVLLTQGSFMLWLGYRTWGTFPFTVQFSSTLLVFGGIFVIVGSLLLAGVLEIGKWDDWPC